MKEESNFYSFILTLFAFIGFIIVFSYNIYVGNGIDYALFKASLAAFFSFLLLKCFIYCLERARSRQALKALNAEGDKPRNTI